MTTNKDYIPKTGDSYRLRWLASSRPFRAAGTSWGRHARFRVLEMQAAVVPFETRVTAKAIETGRGRSITAAKGRLVAKAAFRRLDTFRSTGERVLVTQALIFAFGHRVSSSADQ